MLLFDGNVPMSAGMSANGSTAAPEIESLAAARAVPAKSSPDDRVAAATLVATTRLRSATDKGSSFASTSSVLRMR
jgi:hypothetical protein